MHPQKQSWFASAVNWNNEVSMWNVESMMRQEMLWASPYPPSFTGSEVRQSGYWNHDSCDPPHPPHPHFLPPQQLFKVKNQPVA